MDSLKKRVSAAVTMKNLQIRPFAQTSTVFLALCFVPGLLNESEMKGLLGLLRCTNWSPKRQGGYPATFVTIARLATLTGLAESTVEQVLKRFGVEEYRARSKDGGTVDRAPLGILRTANEDEQAKVLEDFEARVGAPPAVRIFQDPSEWTLPKSARREFLSRLSEAAKRQIWPDGTDEWERGPEQWS